MLYVFNKNDNIGFIKGHMCSPAIATQAEDLIAGGVKELINVGYAGVHFLTYLLHIQFLLLTCYPLVLL